MHPTPSGQTMMLDAEKTAAEHEENLLTGLSAAERQTLLQLLQKVYK